MRAAPYPFSLRQLQYAVVVGETLSFRKAAERCHVSQPALSAQLQELESGLGVRLFERDRRRVLPTQAGRELLERAARLLVGAEDLLVAARRVADPLSGSLRLGVIPTVSPYLLPDAAPALRAAFPRLELMWVEDRTPALIQALEAGALDGALLALEAKLGDVEREVIATDPFLLATHKAHPLAKGKGKAASTADLRDAGVLLLEDGHCLRDQALGFCTQARARELEFRATSLTTLAQMVAGGSGVTLLPRLAVATEALRAGLHVRPFVNPPPARTIGLVWRRGSPVEVALRQVAATLRKAYPKGEAQAAGRARSAKP